MNYRKFLGKTETLVLPHFGGAFVETQDRRLRLDAPLDQGWWQFEIKGRKATMIQAADTESSALENLPLVRGHVLGDRLVRNGAVAEPIYFLPADQPAPLAPLRARTWPRGQLIFEAVEFEGEAEETARRALEDQGSLREARGIPATLRAAFGYAVVFDVARTMSIEVSPAEVAGEIVAIAESDSGRELAATKLRTIQTAREEEARRARDFHRNQTVRGRAEKIAEERAASGGADAEDRADQALASTGASLLGTRQLAGDLMEVKYRLLGERFITIVDRRTLRVIDAGVCLAGSDQLVTLESLPGVIRQAIAEQRLVITRR